MTREELEEGRRLRDACNSGDALEYIGSVRDFEIWLRRNAAELLSLAEEARWRSVAEEPPPIDSLVLIAHPRPTGYLGRDGKWVAHGKFLDSHDYPKHWRPLPKGPER